MPLYREDLQWPPLRCEAPGCDGRHGEDDMWFHPACHRGSPTRVLRRGDVLTLRCARCERDLVSLVVARNGNLRPVRRRCVPGGG